MALKRRDACSHMMKAGAFVTCTMVYDADYLSQRTFFSLEVVASDLAGIPTPTDAQVHGVADPRATALYTTWKNQIDRLGGTVTAHAGQAATVVA